MIKIGSKKINYFLSSLILFIWSAVFYIVWNGNSSDVEVDLNTQQNENINSFLSLNISAPDSFYSIKLHRDPFQFDKIIEPSEKLKSSNVPVSTSPHKPVRYKINGVILNNRRKMIVLEDLDENKTVFLRERELYKTLLVKSILKSKIVLVDNNEEKIIQLNIQ